MFYSFCCESLALQGYQVKFTSDKTFTNLPPPNPENT